MCVCVHVVAEAVGTTYMFITLYSSSRCQQKPPALSCFHSVIMQFIRKWTASVSSIHHSFAVIIHCWSSMCANTWSLNVTLMQTVHFYWNCKFCVVINLTWRNKWSSVPESSHTPCTPLLDTLDSSSTIHITRDKIYVHLQAPGRLLNYLSVMMVIHIRQQNTV